jgi:hypothetical protein
MPDDVTVFSIDLPEEYRPATIGTLFTALREGLQKARIQAHIGLAERDTQIQFTFGDNAIVEITPFDQMSSSEINGGHLGILVKTDNVAMISTKIDGQIARTVRIFPNTETSRRDRTLEYSDQLLSGASISGGTKRSQQGNINDVGHIYRVMSMAPSDALS